MDYRITPSDNSKGQKKSIQPPDLSLGRANDMATTCAAKTIGLSHSFPTNSFGKGTETISENLQIDCPNTASPRDDVGDTQDDRFQSGNFIIIDSRRPGEPEPSLPPPSQEVVMLVNCYYNGFFDARVLEILASGRSEFL